MARVGRQVLTETTLLAVCGGAIGVAGSPSPEQDVQCCRVALAVLSDAGH